MSYHDKLLAKMREGAHPRVAVNVRRALMRGLREVTLKPTTITIHMGSLYDDVSAVGSDMRKAMEDFRARD